MVEAKTKKVTSRSRRKAANSPIPSGPIQSTCGPCGHSGCTAMCKVRFVGPTSSMRDHHIMHAARGVTNVWTAAIVAGLAVVLTGAIAYTAVEARSTASNDASANSVMDKLTTIDQRLNNIEDLLRKHVSTGATQTP